MYTEKVMKQFKDPKNMGEMEKADGVGKVGNPTCGDLMELYIKVDKNDKGDEIIKDISVKTFGCVAAIATSSIITEMAKGMTLDAAYDLSNKDVAEELGGLPKVKMHCSNLAADALKRAIEDYKEKKKD